MKILIVEPFCSGSHKKWVNGIKEFSSHEITILSLPGAHWKWRMHGASITLARKYQLLNENFDIILCSDMMDIALFKALIAKNTAPIGIYFHENQLTYPWSETDPDPTLERNIQYGFINYTSALVADFVWFNSEYHQKSFLNAIRIMLHNFPDQKNIETISIIESKSKVMYFGITLSQITKYAPPISLKTKDVVILWNHRWEYDKDPNLFFTVLLRLKEKGIRFKLIVLGESFQKAPAIFNHAKTLLQDEIIHWGYCEKEEEYTKLLYQSDILFVTNKQDFFGISVLEAMASNVFPLLPFRLSYPEFFPEAMYPTFFYEIQENAILHEKYLCDRLQRLIFDIKYPRGMNLSQWVHKFDWNERIKEWDEQFSILHKI